MSFISYLGIIFWFIFFSVCHFMQCSFIFELLLLLLLLFCFVLRQDPTLTQAGLETPYADQTCLGLTTIFLPQALECWDYRFVYAQTSGLQIVLFLKCLTRTHARHKQVLLHGQWRSHWKVKASLVRLAARQCCRLITWMTETNPLMAGRLSKEGPGRVKDWKRSPSSTVGGCLLLYPPRAWRAVGFFFLVESRSSIATLTPTLVTSLSHLLEGSHFQHGNTRGQGSNLQIWGQSTDSVWLFTPPMECLDSVQSLPDNILLSRGSSSHILHFHSYYFYFELLLCYRLNVSPQNAYFNQVWWQKPAIPALTQGFEGCCREDEGFTANLRYTANSKLVWASRDPVSRQSKTYFADLTAQLIHFKPFLTYLLIISCVCAPVYAHGCIHVVTEWRSQDNTEWTALTFHSVDPRDWLLPGWAAGIF